MLLGDHELLDFRPDAITANNHVREDRGAVFKRQTYSRRSLYEILKPFAKMQNLLWYKLDQSV